MYNPFSLSGKTILVTGASSGIGRGIAIECSKLGARVIITGRNENKLEETSKQLTGENHLGIIADISSTSEIDLLLSRLPVIDGIVHSAGLTSNAPFQFASREKLDEVMNVNFFAPFEITRRIMKSKLMTKAGSIVFISSISGVYCSTISLSIYSSSKGALNGFVKGLALELAPKGIRVNSINPGIVETNIFNTGTITTEQLELEKNRYPLKRFGTPQDIAYAVIYLLSDASKWVTGSNLLIDGGFTLQ